MKIAITHQYQKSLLAYLRHKDLSIPQPVRGLGGRALVAGMKTLDVARLHEETLVSMVLPLYPRRKHVGIIKRAGMFFAQAMTPVERKPGDVGSVIEQLKRNVALLSRRTVALAGANHSLSLEVTQRKAVEQTLKQSERRYAQLLEQSDRFQEQLRHMSRKILSAQEDERKNISRELHDVIAQTLTGINIRLDALKKEAITDATCLDRSIARTQRLVIKAVGIVHTFARELRPAVLDDLGLIAALHTFIKPLAKRAGLRARMVVCSEVEQLNMNQRTVLFRVAQEALTNVARHAHASQVTVNIRLETPDLCMQIHDDGTSFDPQRILLARKTSRLGLLGMRERLEMLGGSFAVESSPGHGTTITARIPLGKPGKRPKTAAQEVV